MRTTYSLMICWRQRTRYLPAVLAVAFSALLIALQVGLLLGILAVASRPIDRAHADIWIASRHATSLGFGHSIPTEWRARLLNQPAINRAEPFLLGFGIWHKPDGGTERCYVIGARLEEDAPGMPQDLTAPMRRRLTEVGTVAVYAGDLGIPRWRLRLLVLSQAFWVALAGISLAIPAIFGLARMGAAFDVAVALPGWLLGGTAAVTALLAIFSGLVSLRSLRRTEPAILLR